MINCPNPDCQATNSAEYYQCESCQSFLPHRYLWAVGDGDLLPGELGERYLWQHQRVVLESQPGLPPVSPDPVPPEVWPYLMLAPHTLHVPQPYALVHDAAEQPVLLLDAAAIAPQSGEDRPRLLPTLRASWADASPLRQLNWLWQIAGLWPDFIEQQVAGSLLLGPQLRVHGSVVRLQELAPDTSLLSLADLGKSWQSLVSEAHPSLQAFLGGLCAQLEQGTVATAEMLVDGLDRAIATAAAGYRMTHTLAVLTDQGPSRKRNEDACYPTSGLEQTYGVGPKVPRPKAKPLLLIVCDGIGGHDGGDVASRLAIATIEQQLIPLLDELIAQPMHDPVAVTLAIEQAICAANDHISQHNDQDHRQARDRMGTTLVLAVVIGVHVYIAHVGDSRAYRISSTSCRQITFDDDVAAREVRLGYGFYADAIHRPGTGALVQALGMGHSASLHVSVQRLIFDDDTVLLLCSDGLSDYDRVDQFWADQLLPLLTNKIKPLQAVTNLVQLANIHNGHDNVTTGVVASRVQGLKPVTIAISDPVRRQASTATLSKTRSATRSTARPQRLSPSVKTGKAKESALANHSNPWSLFMGLVVLLGIATAATMVLFRDNPRSFSFRTATSTPETIPGKISQSSEDVGITDDELALPVLTPNSYVRLGQPVVLLAAPQADEDNNTLGELPDGAVVQVLTRQDPAGDQSRWVKLKLCALTATPPLPVGASGNAIEPPTNDVGNDKVTSSPPESLTSGTEGWILEPQLAKAARASAPLGCAPG